MKKEIVQETEIKENIFQYKTYTVNSCDFKYYTAENFAPFVIKILKYQIIGLPRKMREKREKYINCLKFRNRLGKIFSPLTSLNFLTLQNFLSLFT